MTALDLLRGLPPLIAAHLELALVALALGAAISLPLAIAASRRPRLAAASVAVAGVIQTIPGLALLALMVPILAATGGVSPFGFAPALIALTLYALLPILRNAVTGLRGVDPAAVEAARGMGMAPWQVMRLVQLPLAAPVIAAGVRTAAVWTVGAATLATPVGQACLGNYIFAGLQTRNFSMLLAGVAASAALALTLDAILAAFEHSLAGRHRRRAWIPVGALAAFVVIVIGVLPRVVGSGANTVVAMAPSAAVPGERAAVTHVRIGAKTFTEQYILVEVLRARLAAVGISVEVAQSLGSNVIFDALVRGDLDAYVDYTGTLWTNVMHRATNPPRWQVLSEIEGWLAEQHQVRSLGSLGFENTYALAVRRETATRLGLHTLADLAKSSPQLSLGADYEFLSRSEWASVQRVYGVHFARATSFDPALLYEAASRRDVDAISAFSSDGRIAANDLVVLGDPAGALPPYDATILLGPRVANDPRVSCSLESLRIPVELMRQANAMVDRDKASAAAAAAWLLEHTGPAPTCS